MSALQANLQNLTDEDLAVVERALEAWRDRNMGDPEGIRADVALIILRGAAQ